MRWHTENDKFGVCSLSGQTELSLEFFSCHGFKDLDIKELHVKRVFDKVLHEDPPSASLQQLLKVWVLIVEVDLDKVPM